MLIQRVTIQGFKTFAKRTEFLFDPGITAVVGPNGSGKSNIVDAVRWCLGEQSFSLLRSRKTSDVIFSGSDKKARLGMAQVSLLLDNSGGEIPLDYAEVEITRRAYRDGDNEYFVNGQRVRLQDVTQILAQTGLGKRTYSVIGQGLIDRVLSLAPEERRALFEEAAGLTGYHAKREVTLRRLDATQTNLTRVRDITAELAPRMTSLRRQAERAREREQHAADLRVLLREWYGYQWHTAVADVALHTGQVEALDTEIERRRGELAEIAGRIEVQRTSHMELRAVVGERHRAAAELHREAETVGRDLAIAGERLRQVESRSNELDEELIPLRIQHESAVAHLRALESARAETEQALHSRREELAATESALSLLRADQQALRDASAECRRLFDATRQEAAEVRARLAHMQERRSVLLATNNETQRRLSEAEGDVMRAAAALSEAEGAFSAHEARLEASREAIAEVEGKRAALRRALEGAENERRQRDRDVDRLQTRVELLRRLNDEGAGMASGVRAVLQANQPGILGVVATLLRVPQNLDRAIETALGGSLQNLVAATWQDAQTAIEDLKRGQRGRATFLPLDRLSTLPAIAAPRMEGLLGNAADLVGCDEALAPARDHLLNRTWIVTDLTVARRALDTRRDGPRPTVVTLDGEIVRPGGAVTGGSDGERRDDSSVLARTRELRELPAQVEQARTSAQQVAATCGRLALDVAGADADLERLQHAQTDHLRLERAQRQELEGARRRHDQAARDLGFLASQMAAGEGEAATFQERIAALETELGALTLRETETANALQTAEAAVAAAASESLFAELADRRAAEAAAFGQLESRRALLLQQDRTAADLGQQIEQREARRVEMRSEAANLAQGLRALGLREDEVGAALVRLQTEVLPQEARIESLRLEQESLEQEERRLQQAQHHAESQWAHATLSMQRSVDAVGQVRSEIERDLGLVALPASDEVTFQHPLPIDDFVETLPVCEEAAEGLREEMAALRGRLGRLANVNPEAPREYDEAAQRYEFLTAQAEDLEAAAADLRKVIAELDQIMRSELSRTFKAVADHFKVEFQKLFNGGSAELILTEPDNVAESGIEIIARPPGKRPQSLALLSGGERSLAACALIFAILRVSPTPFCVLDEVDAALDEANVDRFRMAVEDLAEGTQFIIVTHNRRTLEGSNTIYGITMGDDGVSRVISLRLEGGHIVHHTQPANGGAPEESALDDDAGLAEIEEVVRM